MPDEKAAGYRELKSFMQIDKNERAGGYRTMQSIDMDAAQRHADAIRGHLDEARKSMDSIEDRISQFGAAASRRSGNGNGKRPSGSAVDDLK